MKIRRAGAGVVAAVGVGLLAMAASPAARAQVKLEYKFPEGKTLTYKTTMKMNQILTLMGMEIPTEVEETIVTSRSIGKRGGDSTLPVQAEGRIAPHRIVAPGRHPDHLRLEGPRRQDRQRAARVPGRRLQAGRRDRPTRSSSTTRTRSRRSRGPRSSWRRPTSSTQQVPRLDAVRGSRPTSSRRSSSRSTATCRTSWPGRASRGSGPRPSTSAARRSVFRKKYEYAGTEKKGDKTLDKITVKTIEVKTQGRPQRRSRRSR